MNEYAAIIIMSRGCVTISSHVHERLTATVAIENVNDPAMKKASSDNSG